MDKASSSVTEDEPMTMTLAEVDDSGAVQYYDRDIDDSPDGSSDNLGRK